MRDEEELVVVATAVAVVVLMVGFAVECLRVLLRVVEVLVDVFLDEDDLVSSLCFSFPCWDDEEEEAAEGSPCPCPCDEGLLECCECAWEFD